MVITISFSIMIDLENHVQLTSTYIKIIYLLPPAHPPLPPPSSYTTTVLTLRIMFILDIILHPHDQTTIKMIQIQTETQYVELQAGADFQMSTICKSQMDNVSCVFVGFYILVNMALLLGATPLLDNQIFAEEPKLDQTGKRHPTS